MSISWINRNANGDNDNSYANKLRKARLRVFEEFFWETIRDKLSSSERIRILDLGGTLAFWKSMDFQYIENVDITLANLHLEPSSDHYPNIRSIVADGTNLSEIRDNQFDLVFSNSCIEHVGSFSNQQKMAKEIRRIASHYFVQTPNFFFPIEPHFLFPMFQFLPIAARVFLVQHFQLASWPKGETKETSLRFVSEIKLLKYNDLVKLFPTAAIHRERVFGFTTSFMAFE